MRTDPRYSRVRAMLTDEAVPRLNGRGIALCRLCQRRVYFSGGFLNLLLKHLDIAIKQRRAPKSRGCGRRWSRFSNSEDASLAATFKTTNRTVSMLCR